MTRYKEYVFRNGDVITTIVLHKTKTDKLGNGEILIGTWHFGIDQLREANLKLDKLTCMDCPKSYNSGDASCYTHKYGQRMGLQGMMRRLRKLDIEEFNSDKLDSFIQDCIQHKHQPKMIRFGVYGEPVTMPVEVVEKLTKVYGHVGYTHQWHKKSADLFKPYFMASCENPIEESIATSMGWRTFTTADTGQVLCPASKEAGKKTVCSACMLCSGAEGRGKTNIYIPQH